MMTDAQDIDCAVVGIRKGKEGRASEGMYLEWLPEHRSCPWEVLDTSS